MTARLPLQIAAVLAALLITGCAPADPYNDEEGGAGPRTPPDAAPNDRVAMAPEPPETGELRGHAPSELLDQRARFPRAGQTPETTLERGALLYGNWTSASAASRLRQMAALTIGQAHAEVSQAAAQALTDWQQSGVRSRATVEATSVKEAGQRRSALVVTRERVTGPDLPQAGWRYRVTTATLERRADGWVIAQWTPQP
jgi:hypothetical protein